MLGGACQQRIGFSLRSNPTPFTMGRISGRRRSPLEKHAVVIPTYNERENIVLLVESLLNEKLG